MRRTILLSVFAVAALLVISGGALAVNRTCSGDCRGTAGDGRARDVLDCGGGTDTVYFVPDQDAVNNCEVFNPPE